MLDNYRIGNQITLLRKEKGLTGEKLAEFLNVSPQAVSKWENGKCLPDTTILPQISEILGTSIDSLLMPKELLILNAVYTDGVKVMNVTQIINNYVNYNKLSIIADPRYFGLTYESDRVSVLVLKYQTPKGIYYTYAVQNSNIEISVTHEGYSNQVNFEVIGAYYGSSNVFQSVMTKMRHYEYFKWNDIHVNHESFPSSPGTDESEYLTIIYTNLKGIHVISCKENETLSYSIDRTELFLKDTSSCILPGIKTLEWEKGMDCTWAGAIHAALSFMNENYTYEDIMGMSGSCYRIAFTEVWDWSAVDALVAFDYSSILFHSIGYEQISAHRVHKDGRSEERMRIMKDLREGKPVVAINLRIAPEWGVITGYKENGKVLLCRTYFDKEYLNETKDYLEMDSWPFIITHFGEKLNKPQVIDILYASLHALVDSFEGSMVGGYYQGEEAFHKWIEGLKADELWDNNCMKEDIDRRLAVNDSMLLNLIDARRCANEYLTNRLSLLEDDKSLMLAEVARSYKEITYMLKSFRDNLMNSSFEDFRYNVINTKLNYATTFRMEEVKLLQTVVSMEKEIVDIVKRILK